MRIRVLLVDDFEPCRVWIASTLRSQRGFEIVGEAQDGVEAIEFATKLQPDLIVLDVGLPKLDGIEAARYIRLASPGSRILMVSANSSHEVAQLAMYTGVQGFVVKSYAAHELLPAVNAILCGDYYISTGIATPGSETNTNDA